ncbi:hypothetical protein BH10BAC5_BH10BAC5_16490 [soil metagenome]
MNQNFIKIFTVVLFCLLTGIAGNTNAQVNNWSPLGSSAINGTNGIIKTVSLYNGNIIAAGGFTNAGAIAARNIAMWDGTSWSPLGTGLGSPSGTDTIYALAVYNGELYAGGNFTLAGGNSALNIAKWNGTAWNTVGSGINGEVRSLIVYNSKLYAGGDFDYAGSVSANRIARWNGTVWTDVGGGFNTNNGSKVFAFTIFNTKLIVGGRFNTAGGSIPVNNVASWDETSWTAVGNGFGSGSDRIFSLAVNNSILYCGGKSSSEYNIAYLEGAMWRTVGGGMDNDVNTVTSYKGNLIVGGNFKRAGGLYVDRIAQWNGNSWSRLLTGMNEKVYSVFSLVSGIDTILIAGGEFTTAGGKSAKHIAIWKTENTSTVSGQVKYADNSQPVLSGKVKILRRDISTQEVIVVDSAVFTNGSYVLPIVPRDEGLKVVIFPNDVLDYVPTYFPSTVDWASATPLTPINNLSNINVSVFRMDTTGTSSSQLHVGGYAYLNFVPAAQPGNFPYNSDAIIYLKQGSVYKGFGVSNTIQQYNISHVPSGSYTAYVNRVGYQSSTQQINVAISLDTVNFNLDTSSVTSVHSISNEIPGQFSLEQNYPNPFNPSTTIRFTLANASFAKLSVYNLVGQKVAELVNGSLIPGTYELKFNASALPSGIYFYKLNAGSITETKKMILIK